MQKIPASKLKFDAELYPRAHGVDRMRVNDMRTKLRNGAKFPPIVVWNGKDIIVDGAHRWTAQKEEFGDETEVECEVKEYSSIGMALRDAASLNDRHGLPLTRFDRRHTYERLRRMNVSIKQIASAFGIKVEDMKAIGEGRIARVAADGPRDGKLENVVLKRTVRHMAGQELTAGQVDANRKLSGMDQYFYVDQLLTLIDSGMLDRENANLMDKLSRLYAALEPLVASAAVA